MNKEFLSVNGTIGFYDSVKACDALTNQAQATSWINELSKEGIMVLYILTKVDGKACYYRQRTGGDGIESVSEAAFISEFMPQNDVTADPPKSELPQAVENEPSETDFDVTTEEDGYNGGDDSAEDSDEEDSSLGEETDFDAMDVDDGAQLPPLLDYEKIRRIIAEELEDFFKKKLG